MYRDVQLDLLPEIEVFHMLFEKCRTKNRKRSIKQHMNYFNFRSKIQLDHPVGMLDLPGVWSTTFIIFPTLPVLQDLIIMQSEISSWSTDSMNIMSRSLTMAPLITMISSPLMIPARKKRKGLSWQNSGCQTMSLFFCGYICS